jgi:hypothetical protein
MISSKKKYLIFKNTLHVFYIFLIFTPLVILNDLIDLN